MVKVIGLIGLIGAGKGFVADYISKIYNYKVFSMGSDGIIGKVTKSEGLELSRENLQNISQKYREKYGMDYFAKLVVKDIIDSRCSKALINEVRKPEDVKVPRNQFGKDFLCILVDAEQLVRFDRLRKRVFDRDPKTFQEFLIQEKREFELYFNKSLGLEDCKLDNNGTFDDLKRNIDKLLIERGFN